MQLKNVLCLMIATVLRPCYGKYCRFLCGKLNFWSTRPKTDAPNMFYTKFHSPRPNFRSPSSKSTRSGERASLSFPDWIHFKLTSTCHSFKNHCKKSCFWSSFFLFRTCTSLHWLHKSIMVSQISHNSTVCSTDTKLSKLCITGPCITNVFATRLKNFSQWYRSFQRKLLSHWLKFLRHVAITLVIQGPGSLGIPLKKDQY